MRRLPFGSSCGEVAQFVSENRVVADFLGKYQGCQGTKGDYGRYLFWFFRWLKLFEGLEFSPKAFLKEHIRKRGSLDVEDRRWALQLVLKFSRDNTLFVGRADGYKYRIFMALKQFFDFYEAPLQKSICSTFQNSFLPGKTATRERNITKQLKS